MKRTIKKLHINTQTLRTLTKDNLTLVAGGAVKSIVADCSQVTNCSSFRDTGCETCVER